MSLAILVLKEGGGRPTTTGLLGSELLLVLFFARIAKVTRAAYWKWSALQNGKGLACETRLHQARATRKTIGAEKGLAVARNH